MPDRVFVDTNLFVYALTTPRIQEDYPKREAALALFETLIEQQKICISVQVLNELHTNLIRKFKLDDTVVFDMINESVLPITSIAELNYHTYTVAYNLRAQYHLSYWDSLIAASAIENQCGILYSEDMHDGLLIEETLHIINPLGKSSSG